MRVTRMILAPGRVVDPASAFTPSSSLSVRGERRFHPLLAGAGRQGVRALQAPIGEMASFEGSRYGISQPPNTAASAWHAGNALRYAAHIPARSHAYPGCSMTDSVIVSFRRATSKPGIASLPEVAELGIHPRVRANGTSIYRRYALRKTTKGVIPTPNHASWRPVCWRRILGARGNC